MKIIVNNVYLNLKDTEDKLPVIISQVIKVPLNEIEGFKILKKAVDARNKKRIVFVYSLLVELNRWNEEVYRNVNVRKYNLKEDLQFLKVSSKKRPIVVGFGPCGMFAALALARASLKPIIIERGKKVEERLEDVKLLREKSILNPSSNVCFGEGGAGTFSDGKLNTGVKDSRIKFVLNEFIKHGAPQEIYYQAHPHVGSDNLINIVKNIREEIISLGGEFLFETTFIDYLEKDGVLKGIIIEDKDKNRTEIKTNDCILAIGHSARDTFVNLYNHNLTMKPKPFSIGVRIEHLQEDLDKCQYGNEYLNPVLPKADYKQVIHLNNGRTVYTFCMCPGGEVVASSSETETIVTNGMSYYKRDLVNCNSALLVSVNVDDYYVNSPLDGMYFQESIERKAFSKEHPYYAPCQLVGDFLNNKNSEFYGKVKPTYKPGVYFRKMSEVLPYFVASSLKESLPLLSKKMKLFKDKEAIITGVETRSSSPISIPRDEDFNSSIKGLYPGGEGASYAGGIMSSCLDGLKISEKIIEKYSAEKKSGTSN